MTQAIIDATGGKAEISFTHVGIISVEADGIYVIEAKSEPGVTMTPLQRFLDASATIDGRPAAMVARLHRSDRKETCLRAVREAKKYIGQPYDNSFLPDNGKMYCSELVWESFLDPIHGTHLFPARPMNFRAADGSLPQFWVEHFSTLNEPVPENIPGTNPDDMSRETILRPVHRYYR